MFTYLANISTSIADSWRKCKESLATAAKAGGSNLTSKSPSTLLVNRPITWLWAASKRSFFTAYEYKSLKMHKLRFQFIKKYDFFYFGVDFHWRPRQKKVGWPSPSTLLYLREFTRWSQLLQTFMFLLVQRC